MALTEKVRRGKWFISGTLLDAVAADTSGEWLRLDGIFPATITVSGSFTATVTLYVEQGDSPPTDADANHGSLNDYTSPDIYVLNSPVVWIKAVVSGYSAGAITVQLEASESQAIGP